MHILLGSFKDINNFKNYHPIAISAGLPKWYSNRYKDKDKTRYRYKKLAPPQYLIDQYRNVDMTKEDVQDYTQEYFNTVLLHLNPLQVIKELEELSGGRDIVLLSQETVNEFSHRTILKCWFEKAGITAEHCFVKKLN